MTNPITQFDSFMSDDDNVNHFDDSVKIFKWKFYLLLNCRVEVETIGASLSLAITWVLVKRNGSFGSILHNAMQFCFILRQCVMKL